MDVMAELEQVNSNRLRVVFWVVIVLGILGMLISVQYQKLFSPSNFKSSEGRVNFLILGKSGEGNAGADLTDTMIFASLSLDRPSIILVSIPRDIWIPEIRAKINSAYYWGNINPELGGGIPLAKSLVEKVIGQPVHYAFVMDFLGFKDIIDAVGGVNVIVENTFTDEKYPIAGKEKDLCGGDFEYKCRFETIHFEKGVWHMDGETALKFVRSRNGDNGENTDLAREARQQRVISAIKDEVLSFNNLANLSTDIKIFNVLKSVIETDITTEVGTSLGQKLFLARNDIKSYVFPEEMLINPPISAKYDRQYVFIPRAGDWQEIIGWTETLLKQ